MQFDNMTKEKLLAMDNKSLAELIGRISTAIGADQRKTGALLSDLDGLKKQFAKLSPADAETAEHGGQGKERADPPDAAGAMSRAQKRRERRNGALWTATFSAR